MIQISELKTILGQYFHWNKAHLDCFIRMLLALFVVRTVNFRELAVAFDSRAQIDSRYKRIKRFFSGFSFETTAIASWVFKLFFSPRQKIYLTLDRTNWFWGKSKINILMLAVVYEGIAIPLFWRLLNKAGCASAQEHCQILERFVKTFGQECIAGVLADREFGSETLFCWLNHQKIPFYIRIKEDANAWVSRAKCPVKKLFTQLASKHVTHYPNYVKVFNQRCQLAAGRSDKGELLIVATNQNPCHGVQIYLKRWEIENLFQALKGRGFRFEDTHLIYHVRIEKLIALLVVGFCWAHKVGEWKATLKPIKLYRYPDKTRRPQYSYFRYGLDAVRDILLHIQNAWEEFLQVISQLLIPTREKILCVY